MSRSFRTPVKLPTKPRKGLLALDHRPQHPPTSPSLFRTPVAVRTVRRKDEPKVTQLMELDNTLLNAVDLENIQQTSGRKTDSPKNGPSNANLKRSLPVGVEPKIVASTPKRRKSSNGGRKMYVLQMSMEAGAANKDEGNGGENDPARAESLTRSRRSATSCEDDNDDEDMLPCGQEMVCNNETLNTDDIIQDKLRKLSTSRVNATHLASQLPALSDEVFEVFTNPAICSQYMRLDQSVLEDGEHKAELIRSSQPNEDDRKRLAGRGSTEDEPTIPHNLSDEQRRLQMNAVERIFADCERTLHDMTNLGQIDAETIEMVAAEEKQLPPAPLPAPPGPSKMSNTLAAIDWDEEIQQNTVRPRVSSLFLEKGPFYGLPSSVRRILRDFRGIGELYDWQRECLELPAVQERRNLIYALPTSGGKTLVAEILMLREVLCRLHNVLFIVPYVSLAQEKMIALSPFSIELQFLLEEYSGGKGQCPPRKRRKKNAIFVCTIEKAMMLMDSLVEESRANEIGLIVIDELHMIGEPRRGACLEMLITKVQALRAGIQIVGMSATIGNLNEVARFMLADVYCRDFRPVELQEYVKCGEALYEVRGQQQGHGARSEQVFGEKRSLRFEDYTDELRRIDPDGIVGLILQVIPTGSCLVFCPTKRMCENLSAMLAKHLPATLVEHRAEEKAKLIKSLAEDGSVAPILPQSFRVGVAYHHAGLTQDERRTIEDAFRAGVLSLIVCTSTLAAGVNLPAQRVIIRSPYIGTSFLTLSRYKQMVGRAGRAGFGEKGDSILVCAQRDIPQVCEMLCAPMDLAESSLMEDDRVQFKSLLLSAIGLGICGTRDALQTLASSTLLSQQAGRRQLELSTITDEVIVQLYQGNAIKARHDSCLRNPPNMIVTISTAEAEEPVPELTMFPLSDLHGTTPRTATFIRVHKDPSQPGKLIKTIERTSQLEVNRLGKAAIRGGFDMEKALRYYDEMQTLGKRLCVLDEYDLFYLILLEDGREVHLKVEELIALINQLTSEQQRIAERYGIGNVLMTKILTRRTIPDEQMHKMLRFVRVMIVHELWRQTSVQEVAQRYHVNAGSLQTLMNGTAGTAYSLLRMCEEVPELWAFKHLLTGIIERLTHCCKQELMPLMELPSVKLGRAKQLYRAGFTTLASIARAKSKELVESIEHMNYRAANQLILSAKAKLMQEVDALREQAEEYLSQLNR
ncbi:helicase POLQ-like [Anopheles albimanus]|uniref:DNA polymerase theta n=1 Tax=Anopheles albimanus TaxID=7167 RepID=A0A182FU48_ANOAL|nr:helicase POLQ-like [Anopheles albimanus]XP_035788116.1 helicase POLQ-like [Anopheles albimanus]XP_035788117.1 helicase POLQ-like [Anopheles albimanus]